MPAASDDKAGADVELIGKFRRLLVIVLGLIDRAYPKLRTKG